MKKIFLTILITAGLVIGFGAYALPSVLYQNSTYWFRSGIKDYAGSTGTVGYVLSSTGTSTLWVVDVTGGGVNQRVGTSTAGYFTYYDALATVTGTARAQLIAGTLTFDSTTIHTNISATSVTTTNLFYTLLQGTSALLTNVTSTNLNISGQTILASTTITYLNVTNVTTTGLQYINNNGTSLTSTNIFYSLLQGTNAILTSVTTTNLNVTSFSATNVTSTNVSSTNSYATTYTGTWQGSLIAILYGGTNSSTVGSDGCVKYSDGVKLNCSSVGTEGYFLMSMGATTPVWANSTTLPYLGLGYPATVTSTFMQISASTTYNFQSPSIIISSTSLAVGTTTTIPIGPAIQAETWLFYSCYSDIASATVQFGNTAYMTAYLASSTGTTIPTTTVSSNNTFTAGEKRNVQIGNIVNMPNYVACSIKKQF